MSTNIAPKFRELQIISTFKSANAKRTIDLLLSRDHYYVMVKAIRNGNTLSVSDTSSLDILSPDQAVKFVHELIAADAANAAIPTTTPGTTGSTNANAAPVSSSSDPEDNADDSDFAPEQAVNPNTDSSDGGANSSYDGDQEDSDASGDAEVVRNAADRPGLATDSQSVRQTRAATRAAVAAAAAAAAPPVPHAPPAAGPAAAAAGPSTDTSA